MVLTQIEYLQRRFHIIELFYVKLKSSIESGKALTHDEIATILKKPLIETYELYNERHTWRQRFLNLKDAYNEYYNLFLKQMSMKHPVIRDIMERCLMKLQTRFAFNNDEMRELILYYKHRDMSFIDDMNYYQQYKDILSRALKGPVSTPETPSPPKEKRRTASASSASRSMASASRSMASASRSIALASPHTKVKAILAKLPPVK